MKRTLQIFLLLMLGVASFVLFLFLTFPYEVLKETIAVELSQATGFDIRIGEMSATLPLGIEAKDVKVTAPQSGASVSLSGLNASVNPFMLLLGKLKATTELEAGGGNMVVALDFGLLDLIRGDAVPRHVTFDSKAFPLDQLATFGLTVASNAPGANPMVAPLLGAIGLSAQLNAKMDFALDTKNPTQSTGSAEISLGKAILKLSHPSLGLPDQAFKKATIKAKVEQGNFVLDKDSGFISDELELKTDGKITLKPVPTASVLDLKIVVKLNAGLKEKFGFLIDAFTQNAASEGQLTMQVRGPMEQPAVTSS
jgi:type II secretion system protein N